MEEWQRQQRPGPKQDDNQNDNQNDNQDDNQDENQDDKTRRPHPGGLTTRLPPGRASTSPPARRSAQPPHPLAGLGPRPAPVSLLSTPPADLIWSLYVPGSLFCPPSLRTLLPLPRVHAPRWPLPAAPSRLASVPPSATAPTTPTVERWGGPSGHGRPIVDGRDGCDLGGERPRGRRRLVNLGGRCWHRGGVAEQRLRDSGCLVAWRLLLVRSLGPVVAVGHDVDRHLLFVVTRDRAHHHDGQDGGVNGVGRGKWWVG